MFGAIYGFNTGIRFRHNHRKGLKWLPFITGVSLCYFLIPISDLYLKEQGEKISLFPLDCLP